MKKITFLFVCLLAISLLGFSQNITRTMQFPQPEIIQLNDGYSKFIYPDARSIDQEGNPEMPWQAISLLLPQGTSASSVSIEKVTYYETDASLIPNPAAACFPMSEKAPDGYKPQPNPSIYSQDGVYPASLEMDLQNGFLHGHTITSFLVCPLEFYPKEGKVRFIKEITYSLNYSSTKESKAAEKNLRTSSQIQKRVSSLVDNSEALKQYNYPASKATDIVDMLIITKASYFSDFEEYVDYKSKTGFIIKMISVNEITSNYSGSDKQEKIRNCIIDYYENNELEYVVLAGDADKDNSSQNIIPHRGMTVITGGQDEYDMPSDLYYCGLDGTWNNDGDNNWGEPGEYDIYAEVSIARLSVDSGNEIDNFTNKLIKYQDAPVVSDINNALMIGENLDNVPTWGGDCKDEIINGCSSGGVTVGLPADYDIVTVYDRDSYWNINQIFNNFNNTGVHFLNHLGHSNTDYNMKMYTSSLTTSNFTNDGVTRSYAIGYSQGCYNGSFDNRTTYPGYYNSGDCFAEGITTMATAEVATVANSRYGWYMPGGTNASSQHLDRQFFDAIFGEDIFHIGYVNADSKEDNAAYAGNAYFRWSLYETNLFGDPSMDIWTDVPHDITCSPSLTITLGSTSYSVETGEPFARVALIQNDELIGRGIADENGNADCLIFDPISSSNTIQLSIIAHNANRFYKDLTVISGQPYIVYEAVSIDDATGNNNNQLDYNETVLLDITLLNAGDQVSSGGAVTLNTTNSYITIEDGEATAGEINAGYSLLLEDAFTITASDDLPDNEVVNFTITIVGEETWESEFSIIGHAPALAIGSITINDENGNNNNRLDPGEEISLNIEVLNSGSGDASDVEVSFTTSNTFISGIITSANIATLNSGQNAFAEVSFEIDENVEQGELAELNINAETGAYSASIEWSEFVGLAVEDWETGDFSKFIWENNSTPWIVKNKKAFEGSYCAHSGETPHNGSSELSIELEITKPGEISFYRKVSSQDDKDFLRFYIDNNKKGEWSGDLEWEQVSFPVSVGNHTFKWKYQKDGNQASGWDCAYVDYIVMPPNSYPVWVNEMDNDATIAVFPVPFDNSLNMQMPEGCNNGEITIVNLQGQIVLKANINGETTSQFDTSGLSSGIYLIQLSTKDAVYSQKAIKK